MTTRAALKTAILDDMKRASTADGTRVLAAISAAIKFYQPKRFYFNESRATTFATVAAKSVYTFGTGNDITQEFYKIDIAVLEDTSTDYHLARRDYQEIELLNNATASSSRPTAYAYVAQSLSLYQIPDAAYTIRLIGHIKAAEPAADDTAGNVWFTEAYELIHCRAKAYLYAHIFHDGELAMVMRAAERDALDSLVKATTDKSAAGHIVPTTF